MSGPLPNLRWERFCREYAAGETLTAAYNRAGFKDSVYSRFNASKLSHEPRVRARINELLEQHAEASTVHVQYLQSQLLPALRTNSQDLFDADGNLRPIAELPREVAGAIKSIKFHKETGRISEVVLADKIAAAGLLLRSVGIGDEGAKAVAAAVLEVRWREPQGDLADNSVVAQAVTHAQMGAELVRGDAVARLKALVERSPK
jgi:hypothetical protein